MATIRHNDLEVHLPDGWEDASQILMLGPQRGDFRPSVLVMKDPSPPSETAAAFAARQLPELKRALSGYKLVKEAPAKLGAQSGFLREQTFSQNGRKLAQAQFHFREGSSMVTVTTTEEGSRQSAALSLTEATLTSLKTTPASFKTT